MSASAGVERSLSPEAVRDIAVEFLIREAGVKRRVAQID